MSAPGTFTLPSTAAISRFACSAFWSALPTLVPLVEPTAGLGSTSVVSRATPRRNAASGESTAESWRATCRLFSRLSSLTTRTSAMYLSQTLMYSSK